MAKVTIDAATGALVTGGRKLFPIALSNAPPADRARPGGGNGLAAVAAAGVSTIRTGIADWNSEFSEGQIAQERAKLDAAATHGLLCWLWLGELPNFPPPAAGNAASANEQLLTKVVQALKGHPALLAYKGVDEPRNRFRGDSWIRPAGLIRGYQRVKALDPNHPLVITHAPGTPAAQLTPYRPACDITGADIYPVSYPPGIHSRPQHDLSVVGDVTQTLRTAAGLKPVWMTLQIAWSGGSPAIVPGSPASSLHDERFMASGDRQRRRGLAFFGGHLTQVTTPADAKAGWNWTPWDRAAAARRRATEHVHRRSQRRTRAPKASASDVEVVTAGRPHGLGDRSAAGRLDQRRHLHGLPSRPTGNRSPAATSCTSTFRIRCRLRSEQGSKCSAGSPPRTPPSRTGSAPTMRGSIASDNE
jgi:hypothetical protein